MLDGTYPPGTDLPGERLLCQAVGVARPALREALQRLSRDGWLDIQHGRPTRVRDFMREGNLSLLPGLLKADPALLADFVPNLLDAWALLAQTYTRAAMQNAPRQIRVLLEGFAGLDDRAEPYSRAMWRLHRALIDESGNNVYGLILNSFADHYRTLAAYYYADGQRRAQARAFWRALEEATFDPSGEVAAGIMYESLSATREAWPSIIASGPSEAAEGEAQSDDEQPE